MSLIGVLCRQAGCGQRALLVFSLLMQQYFLRHHSFSEWLSLRKNENSCAVNHNWANCGAFFPFPSKTPIVFGAGGEVCHIKTTPWAKSGSQELVSLALKNHCHQIWGWSGLWKDLLLKIKCEICKWLSWIIYLVSSSWLQKYSLPF